MAEGEGQTGTETATDNPSLDLLKRLEGGVSSLRSEMEGLRGEVKTSRSSPPVQRLAARTSESGGNLADQVQALSEEAFETIYDRTISNELNPETGHPWYDARLRRVIAKEYGRRLISQAQVGFGTTLREVTSRSVVLDQYPQLKDPKSEFSAQYQQRLEEMRADPGYAGLPEIELVAARDVGARMGVLPNLPGREPSLEEEDEEMTSGTLTRGGRPLPRRREPEKPSVASEADLRKAGAKLGLRGDDAERILKIAKDHAENDLGIRAIKNIFGI